MTKPMSDEYLAAFIDAEGHLTINVRRYPGRTGIIRYRHMPVLIIVSTNLPILVEIRDFLGFGHVLKATAQARRKQKWTLHICNRKRLQPLLDRLIPFLRIKRPQAEQIIALCRMLYTIAEGKPPTLTEQDIQRRDNVVSMIRVLNKRGI